MLKVNVRDIATRPLETKLEANSYLEAARYIVPLAGFISLRFAGSLSRGT